MGLTKQQREELRRVKTAELYSCMEKLGGTGIVVGMDEVGRGALAGPLTVAAVVLPEKPQIVGLDDSKKLSPARRSQIAAQVREHALGIGICHIQPADIDADGMSASLRAAFKGALDDLAFEPDAVLIDGNPLHIHQNETCVVKGDGQVACIAAASIVAKVTRDAMMVEYARQYPEYLFDSNKGYGSAAHMDAIREHGPSPIHRRSFLGNILNVQQSLL